MDWRKDIVSRSISEEGKTIAAAFCCPLICDSDKAGQCSTVYASINTAIKGIAQNIPLAHISVRAGRRTYKSGEGWTLPDAQEFLVLDGYTKDIVADGIEEWNHAKEVAYDYATAVLTNAEWHYNGKNINCNATK